MRVRPATTADAAAVGAVHVAGWREAYRGLMPEDVLDALEEAPRADAWRERIAAGTTVLVAEDGGEVVGFASAGPARDEGEDGAELYALYLRAARWGSGAGRALHDAALAALPAGPVLLWVLEDNTRARGFYERRGWTADGGRRTLEMDGARVVEARYRRTVPDDGGSAGPAT